MAGSRVKMPKCGSNLSESCCMNVVSLSRVKMIVLKEDGYCVILSYVQNHSPAVLLYTRMHEMNTMIMAIDSGARSRLCIADTLTIK